MYPKIKRLPVYPVPYRKPTLSDTEIRLLFSDVVAVEEKIDGKQMWKEIDGYIVFFEYMRIRHEIRYTKLPCYEIAFDIYDLSTKRFLGVPEKHEILKSHGFCYVPVLFVGEVSPEDWKQTIVGLMRRPSHYGAPFMEGVVVKNYVKQLFAKAVNREFDEAVRGKEHYIRRRSVEYNALYYGDEWVDLCYPRISSPSNPTNLLRGNYLISP